MDAPFVAVLVDDLELVQLFTAAVDRHTPTTKMMMMMICCCLGSPHNRYILSSYSQASLMSCRNYAYSPPLMDINICDR